MNRGLCIVCLLSCTVARGQSFFSASAAESPAAIPNQTHAIAKAATVRQFGAASLKLTPVRNPQVNALYVYRDGKIVCAHCTLHFLATLAFDLPDWQITGGSEWVGDAQFDLEAKTSEPSRSNAGTPLSDQQREMLRALLKDRFRLEGHRESRTATVYILQKSDQRLKLALPSHPSKAQSADEAGEGSIGGAMGKPNISMHELAIRISSVLKRPVVDQTGLSGTFDFACGATANASSEFADTVLDSIKGVGLKLTPALGQVETLVIDHAEPPAEN